MVRKLPHDAFEYYVSLGIDRSYQAVADHYKVSKVTVVNRAKKERWQQELREIEQEARDRMRKKALDDLEAVRERQLKTARYLQSRAIEMLKDLPPEKAVKAAAALSIGWKHELLLLGEPSERTEVDVWDRVREEQERWLTTIEEVEKEPDDGEE